MDELEDWWTMSIFEDRKYWQDNEVILRPAAMASGWKKCDREYG